MTTLPGALRERLAGCYVLERPEVVRHQTSSDRTVKWLLAMADRHLVESVYIPEEDRGALCVSSQVGCTLTCTFCHTGTQRLVRNLEPEEIVGQFMLARDVLGEWPAPTDGRRLVSNIVMMGMGEPLYNFENVKTALGIIMDPEGIALSRRRITLSTSGVVPMMERCGAELGVDLAVSLHAVNDDIRTRLVPLNRKYPLRDLLDACRTYPGAGNARRITFEYVMLKDVNDSDADAHELVRLLKDIPAKVNLIPFNAWPRRALRMLLEDADSRIRKDHQRRRLLGAGASSAGTGHPGSLRPVEVRHGQAAQERSSSPGDRSPIFEPGLRRAHGKASLLAREPLELADHDQPQARRALRFDDMGRGPGRSQRRWRGSQSR